MVTESFTEQTALLCLNDKSFTLTPDKPFEMQPLSLKGETLAAYRLYYFGDVGLAITVRGLANGSATYDVVPLINAKLQFPEKWKSAPARNRTMEAKSYGLFGDWLKENDVWTVVDCRTSQNSVFHLAVISVSPMARSAFHLDHYPVMPVEQKYRNIVNAFSLFCMSPPAELSEPGYAVSRDVVMPL